MNRKKALYVVIFMVIWFVFVPQNSLADDSKKLGSSTRIERTNLIDPIFGIEYNPKEVRFPSAPDIIYKCKDFERPRGSQFLFSQTLKGTFQYYFVYGWMEMHPDGPSHGVRHFEADMNEEGFIVVVASDGCKGSSPTDSIFSPDERYRQAAQKHGITVEIASELLTKAVDQEVLIFGGREAFLRKVSKTGRDEKYLPEAVQAKLKSVRESKTP